jgi:hypothetical protein
MSDSIGIQLDRDIFRGALKYFRRIATRYDKLGSTYLAMIKLAAIRIRLRVYESTALYQLAVIRTRVPILGIRCS